LLGARVESPHQLVLVLRLAQPATRLAELEVNDSVRFTLTVVRIPESLWQQRDVVTDYAIVTVRPPVRDGATTPVLGPQVLHIVEVTESNLCRASYVTRHHYHPEDVHDVKAINRPQLLSSAALKDSTDKVDASAQVFRPTSSSSKTFNWCALSSYKLRAVGKSGW